MICTLPPRPFYFSAAMISRVVKILSFWWDMPMNTKQTKYTSLSNRFCPSFLRKNLLRTNSTLFSLLV
jgi:hypothetical protein